MSKSHIQQVSKAIPIVRGPLDGRERRIKCSPEVEVLLNPLLVVDAESLQELRDRKALTEEREYVVYRLMKSETSWNYSLTDMRSLHDLALFDAQLRTKDLSIGWYLVSFTMPFASFMFAALAMKAGASFMGVGPGFGLYISCWAVASVFGILAAGIGYRFHRNGYALAVLCIFNLLSSPPIFILYSSIMF